MAKALYARDRALCVVNRALVAGTADTEPDCVCGQSVTTDLVFDQCHFQFLSQVYDSGILFSYGTMCCSKPTNAGQYPTFRFPLSMVKVGGCWRLTPGFSRSYTVGPSSTVPIVASAFTNPTGTLGPQSQWGANYSSMTVVASDSSSAQDGSRIKVSVVFSTGGSDATLPTIPCSSGTLASPATRASFPSFACWGFDMEWPLDSNSASASLLIKVFKYPFFFDAAAPLPDPSVCPNYAPFSTSTPVACPDSISVKYPASSSQFFGLVYQYANWLCQTSPGTTHNIRYGVIMGWNSPNQRIYIDRPPGCCGQQGSPVFVDPGVEAHMIRQAGPCVGCGQ